ncbi:MAG: AI-2E family transporter [Gemmatimonadales bacterium]
MADRDSGDIQPGFIKPLGDEGGKPRQERRVRKPIDRRSLLLAMILILASFYTLYFARAVFLPITIAIIMSLLFSPVVRAFRKRGIPEWLSAAFILLLLLGSVGASVYYLAGPANEWVQRAPASFQKIEDKLTAIKAPVEQVTRTAEKVEEITAIDDGETPEVQIKGPSLSATVFGSTQALVVGAVIAFTMLYFLLASGDMFIAKFTRALPRVKDRRMAEAVALQAERNVSTYLFATSAINVGLGIATGVAMSIIGLPNPALWGLVGGLANFVPYIGGIIAVILFALAGMLTFDSLGMGLLPALAYFVLTNLESLVTPVILGRRLPLNPVMIFVSVVFWGWMWGIAGTLMAVPIMATVKIVCDKIEPLAPVGEFLGN